MITSNHEVKIITIRQAANFGSKLAIDLAEKLQLEKINASNWPSAFPITTKHMLRLPEVNNNIKIAKRANTAAKTIWKEIRAEAVAVENYLHFHPEYQEFTNIEQASWRELGMEIEQAAGNIFFTDYGNEDAAKDNVYTLISPNQLKSFMLEFEDDYYNFINEVREAIRTKNNIAASVKLELICMLNINSKMAKRA